MNNSGAQILREIYEGRAANRSYSLRAFARDLGVSHSYLSLILRGKKKLPLATLHAFSAKLAPGEKPISSLATDSESTDHEFSPLEIDKFRLMTRWYYIAILEVIELKGFDFSLPNVARYFGLPLEDAREAIAGLVRLGLLKISNGQYAKTEQRLSVVAPTSMEAIRSFHQQMIAQAFAELNKPQEADFKARDITSMTMPINPQRIAGAKRRITRFRRSLEKYLTQGKCTAVYQFNIQLFPLKGAGKAPKEKLSW